MRIGQTSLLFFGSKLGTSLLGFLATIYFARVLGSDPLGVYFLALAVVTWLQLVGTLGISKAVIKRISEGEERAQYLTAGLTIQFAIIGLLVAVIYAFRDYLESYLGASVVEYVVVVLVANVAFVFVGSVLKGTHRVHTFAVLDVGNRTARRLLQVAAVFASLGITGLLAGYALGTAMATITGVWLLSVGITTPSLRHFKGIVSYAKYAWLGGFQSKTFSWMDTIVLGFFVSSGFIAVYEVAWNIASFLAAFSISISQTLFPEMSDVSTDEEFEKVGGYLQDGLTYCGLFLVPGLLGGLLLGREVLAIYGGDFTRGVSVLVVLILARLVYAYQRQFTNTLNSIDMPDLAFRVNVLFIGSNIALNVVLVYLYGWIGAAVATGLSSAFGLVISYRYVRDHVPFSVPLTEIGRQWAAAIAMATAVGMLRLGVVAAGYEVTLPVALVLIAFGASTFFAGLYAISVEFRTTVNNNLPIELPTPI